MSSYKFLKAYANLPVPERERIIAIIDKKTYSWNAAYAEISRGTPLGMRIVKKLEELKII